MNANWESAERELVMYSQKYSSYMNAYKDLMGKTVEPPRVIVEIGIANGGSLEFWRKAFGEKVRIIGIDLNPNTKELETLGYEVLIADMGKSDGWSKLQAILGDEKINFLIDDGGHTNPQQILAISKGLDLVAPGGILFIEDFQRGHFKVQKPVKFPALTAEIESFHVYLSLIAIKKRKDDSALDATIDLGTDKSLMDYDHRWDEMEDKSTISGKLIGLVLQLDNVTRGIFSIRQKIAKVQSRKIYRDELRAVTKVEN